MYVRCRGLPLHVSHWTLSDLSACTGWFGNEAIANLQRIQSMSGSDQHPVIWANVGFGRRDITSFEAKLKTRQLTLLDKIITILYFS